MSAHHVERDLWADLKTQPSAEKGINKYVFCDHSNFLLETLASCAFCFVIDLTLVFSKS